MSGTELIYWRMLAMTAAMLFFMATTAAPAPVRVRMGRKLARDVVPDLIGAAPGAALIYALYLLNGGF